MESQPTQNPTPEPVQPVSQVPTKSNNSSIVILSVLLLIAVSIAGLFYFQIQKLSKELSRYQVQASPTPTASSDPTADWKTYTNNFYGYSIKYPGDKYTKCIDNKSDVYLDFLEGAEGTRDCRVKPGEGVKFEVIIRKTSADWQDSFNPECFQKEDTTLDGINAVRFYSPRECAIAPALYRPGETYVLAEYKQKLYEIFFIEDKNKEINNQILSTFKFTETEKGVCKATYEVTETPELSAEQNYSLECSLQRNESDCLKVDIYNLAKKDFSRPDGISDCKWTKSN